MERTKDKPSVLVVNDGHDVRQSTVKALSPYFNLTEAATGAEGMAKALAGPDLILLDVNLPDMSGFDVCSAIKKDPATAHLPVLHLSASSPDAASRADSLENGADGFLPLPVETSVLVATIHSLLRIKSAENSLAASNVQLATIAKVDKIFLSTKGEETWEALLAAAMDWFSSAAGSLGYLNESGEMVFGAVAGMGREKSVAEDRKMKVAQPDWKGRPWARAMSSGEIVVSNEALCLALPAWHFKVRRCLSLPLMDGGQPVGHITLANKAHDYTAGDIAFAKLICGHIAALLKGRLDAETQEQRNRLLVVEMGNMQKIESLGQLAGGIAHDFNNILTGIMGNLSVLNADDSLSGEVRETIKDTLAASTSAQKITRQLLTFAAGGLPVKKVFNFGEGVASWCSFSMRGSKSKALVSIALDLWPVNGDEGQLSQVVNNLLRNSQEAMPRGGGLKVAAENVKHRAVPGLAIPAGDYVLLSVADNGAGIPAKYLDRIFEPYFTTKTQGHGLGLAMAYSIIKNHGGHIKVQSRPGSGTEFKIYLPAAAGEVPAPRCAEAVVRKGSGRVLVVDDEEIVRKAASRMLTALGYECACAADGAAALGLYKAALGTPGEFKAVIMDLTLPGGMDGTETVKRLLELNPQAKVVVSSGYSEDNILGGYQAAGFSAALMKPYKYEDLAAVIAKLLYSPTC